MGDEEEEIARRKKERYNEIRAITYGNKANQCQDGKENCGGAVLEQHFISKLRCAF